MSDPRAQQPNVPGAPAPQPGYPTQPIYYASPAPKPGFWTVFGRTLRLLLRRVIYGFVVVWRALRPVWIPLLLMLVLLFGCSTLWLASQASASTVQQPADTRIAVVQPADSVVSYLQGQQSLDVDKMWDAFSPTYQASRLEQGATKQTLKAQLEDQKQRGITYQRADYIGGQTISGGQLFFYTLQIDLNGSAITVPVIFTVDTTGKIVRVNMVTE